MSSTGTQTAATAPRVLLVSPNSLLIAGLQSLLSGEFDVLAACPDSDAARACAARHRPELTLLDIELGDVVELTDEIVSSGAGDVVLLDAAGAASDELLLRVLRAGAAGYLPANASTGRLTATLRGVLEGEAALPRKLVRQLLGQFRARPAQDVMLPDGRRVRLTVREAEVLQLVRLNHTTTQISRRLSIEPVTVRTYVAALSRKLRVGRDAMKDLQLR